MKHPPPSFDAATEFHALCDAARRAARGKKRARATAEFLFALETEALALQRELLAGTYRPRPYHTFEIYDPKPRTISAADFRDRVVHHALCHALEPILERYAIRDSYACRPGKGILAALHRVRAFAGRFEYVLRLDVRRFFASIDHAVLIDRLARYVSDPRLMALARTCIEAGAPHCLPGRGLPIGNLTSQHFANFYLGAMDRFIKQTLRVRGYVRYMDDLVILSDCKRHLWTLHDQIAAYVSQALRLDLNARATQLMPVTQGIPFLGFRIWPRVIRFNPRNARRFRRHFRNLRAALDDGLMTEDHAVRCASALLGWARHGDTHRFRISFFARLDEGSAYAP